MSISRTSITVAALLVGALSHRPAAAASISENFSGALLTQAQVVEETFSVSSSSTFTAYTTSYGGGMNVNGTTSLAGGFQPSLILFDGTGMYVAGQSYSSPMANKDPMSGQALDSYLTFSNLSAGTYTLTLTDWLNQQSPTAMNLSDGFTFNLGSGGSTFVDQMGTSRSSAYSLNLTSTAASTATPEPSTAFLILPALAGVALFVRKRRQAAI